MSPTTETAAPLPRRRPADAGVPPTALDALVRRWEATGVEVHGLVVLRDGAVVADLARAPYDAHRLQLVYSVSKTFTACAVGLAEAEGLLRLDERLVEVFPEAAHLAGPRAASLTLHDVLTMSTGHTADTLVWRGAGLASFPAEFLAAEPPREPGSWFVYNSGATLMAALAVQRRTGLRLLDYLRPRLLDPVGIGDAAWSGSDGLDAGYSGLHVSTEAVARLGELLRLDGVWAGGRVLPEGWVDRMTTAHVDTTRAADASVDWRQGYGYQVWRCRHDAYRADGAWGQFSVVVPAARLVVAVTSCSTDTQALLDAVWEELLPHLTDTPLPASSDAPGAPVEPAAALPPLPAPRPAPGAAPGGDGPWEHVHEPAPQHPALRSVAVARAGSGWRLTVDDGEPLTLPCGDGAWSPDDGSPYRSAGAWTAPGVFEARVAAVETPHVLDLRCADGRVEARWNGEPLGWSALAALRAPR